MFIEGDFMSALHQLIPFGDEMKSKQFTAYLGREIPDNARYGRNPKADEVMEAFELADFVGLTARLEGSPAKSWVIVFTDAAGEKLRIDVKQRGKDKENLLYTITGDRDVLERLVAYLPEDCGSFLISTDGQNPVVVTAGVGD